ncbi:Uncharacterised protein [uncultured archaeon]|nr:Uncharacterised protein [uncultured archaeon]
MAGGVIVFRSNGRVASPKTVSPQPRHATIGNILSSLENVRRRQVSHRMEIAAHEKKIEALTQENLVSDAPRPGLFAGMKLI